MLLLRKIDLGVDIVIMGISVIMFLSNAYNAESMRKFWIDEANSLLLLLVVYAFDSVRVKLKS